MIIEQENTVQTQSENRDSEEEMSYSEIASHFLGELVPGRGRAVTCIVILLGLLVLTLVFWGSFGWRFYEKGPTGAGQKMSQITAQKIRLVHRLPDGTLSSEIPSWIHENIPETIYNTLLLNPSTLSIYSEKLIEYTQNALKEVYWIQKVERIRKFYPAFLEIEVVFRRPALVVSVSGDSLLTESSGKGERGHFYYIPLSSDCHILPMEMDEFPVPMEELEKFPTFCGEAPTAFYDSEEPLDVTSFPGCQPPRSQKPGTLWSYDAQIRDAVEIVNLLGDRWQKFGFDYLCIENKTDKTNETYAEKEFCIVTKNGSRIHWGKCTREAESKDEILDTDKIVQLDKMFKVNGGMDSPNQSFNITFRQQTNQEKTSHASQSQH